MAYQPIETERLTIRRFRPDDFWELFEYLSDEDVVRYEPYETYTRSEAVREAEFRSHSDEFFAVTPKGGRLIGNLYLGKRAYETRELGFVFSRAWQGQGYATEAARALLTHAFSEWDVHRVTASCDPRNERSRKLMERLGMRREGEFRQSVYYKRDAQGRPIWQDTLQYAILRDEWNLS